MLCISGDPVLREKASMHAPKSAGVALWAINFKHRLYLGAGESDILVKVLEI